MQTKQNHFAVIVIGAGNLLINCFSDYNLIFLGASGLACANHLTNQIEKNKILILEARDRIGGRVHTDYDFFPSCPIELGGEFIHGDKTVTMQLAKKMNLEILDAPRKKQMYWKTSAKDYQANEQLSKETIQSGAKHVSQLPMEVKKQLQKMNYDIANCPKAFVNVDMSVYDYFLTQGWNKKIDNIYYSMDIPQVLLGQPYCCSLSTISLLDFMHEQVVDTSGEGDFRVKTGYTNMFKSFSKELNIKFNSQVKTIKYSKQGVEITTTNGQAFTALKCVITIPVALLQDAIADNMFVPQLNSEKTKAIQAFTTEGGTKLIYVFDKLLWPEDCAYLCSTAMSACRWWTPMFGRKQQPNNSNVIVAYITSARATYFDNMEPETAKIKGLEDLAVLLGRQVQDLQIHLTKFKRVSWGNEPLTKGAYAHLPPNHSKARFALEAPIDNVLYFAGEACCITSNPQTVHGAFETGIIAATKVLQSLYSSKL